MLEQLAALIATSLSLSVHQVNATIRLLEDGGTVPFISRYRKEATGGLDEVQVSNIREQLARLKEVEKRRQSIITTIKEQGALTPELEERLNKTWVMTELEDLYMPYKPRKKTKASIAREKRLEPLAGALMKQEIRDVESLANKFVRGEVKSVDEALQGARDIIAEWINERVAVRNSLRRLFEFEAIIATKVVKGKEEEGQKYRDYFAYSGPVKHCPSHRLLAILRGESEGFLRVSVRPEEERALDRIRKLILKGSGEATDEVEIALQDAYKRLLLPSMEKEVRNWAREKADEEAIRVFAENLRQLLLAPPLGQMRVLAIDPGFRTGCKVVVLDGQGNLLHNETIHPHKGPKEEARAASKIANLVKAFKVEALAIGDATAGRETEEFIKKKVYLALSVKVFMVNESGASVYSASSVAREEFPDYDVTVRGSVSIGRRLMDPLAELVKIDPKSIGVGQYQHDVNQTALKKSLDEVVESCVNRVGVNLNTASKHLLTYVSGLGPQLAENIVKHRKENGPFSSRKELLKVSKLGPKAFEQAAGFLRIPNAANPLDNSAVHPERYALVAKMAKDNGRTVESLIESSDLVDTVDIKAYVSEEIGLPTLEDILEELAKPGRDPRGAVKVFSFAKGIRSIDDLQIGMIIPGLVTNITNFGAFVNIGVKQDGLVHVSQLANRFVSDPNEVVKLSQEVMVKVIDVDIPRKRIQLSIKQAEG